MKKFISTIVILSIFISFTTTIAYCLQNPEFTGKTIYLTFDDGPNKNTTEILDLLKKYNMKATFFLLEDRINAYPEIVMRIFNEGHSIGLHGQSHEKTVFYASNSSALSEINNTNHTLKELIGCDIKLVRVPYGSKPHLTETQYNSLVNYGYKVWDWNIDSTDTCKNTNVNSIISNTLSNLSLSKSSVILFHDKQITVKALPNILTHLQSNGYECKSINKNQTPMNWWNKSFY
ncbi:MAG: polysaccharide deacetylase family protein [Peptostreptococcaceae bacterium]